MISSSKSATRDQFNELSEEERLEIMDEAQRVAVQAKVIVSQMTELLHEDCEELYSLIDRLHDLFGSPGAHSEGNLILESSYLKAAIKGV